MSKFTFTSESVTEGHPDKVCDAISDAIVDSLLHEDKDSHIACETLATKNLVVVSGEVRSKGNIDVEKIVRDTLEDIGYTDSNRGMDNKSVDIMIKVQEQSTEIAQGVDQSEDHEQGAGDQGLMFGYACNETAELMPMPIYLAHRLTERLSILRKDGTLPWLGPDGKSQVSVDYVNGIPTSISKVVIATQHDDMIEKFGTEELEHRFVQEEVIENVIKPIIEKSGLKTSDSFIVNGTGRFVFGGPDADTGLTGRKIIVDTYGGAAPHGGGAFSGKDPSKVDRSAAYAARYVAKNVVASKIATKCLIQLAYAIGVSKPLSIYVNLFDGDNDKSKYVEKVINENFDLSPRGIREMLSLNKPIYECTSAYGHFGRKPGKDGSFSWEKTDKIEVFKK